jgi:hypothetical protein
MNALLRFSKHRERERERERERGGRGRHHVRHKKTKSAYVVA